MRYQPDHIATARFMQTGNSLQRAINAAARDIATIARAIAPVRTGEYRDSIRTISIAAGDRVSAGVEADDPAAAPLEFGNRLPFFEENVLVDAARSLGFDVTEEAN